MTDEEKVAFKAEVVAEVGRHLDAHYVKVSDVEAADGLGGLASTFVDAVGRLEDVERFLALDEVKRRLKMRHPMWSMVDGLRRDYADRLRARMADWLDSAQDARPPNVPQAVFDQIRGLFRSEPKKSGGRDL